MSIEATTEQSKYAQLRAVCAGRISRILEENPGYVQFFKLRSQQDLDKTRQALLSKIKHNPLDIRGKLEAYEAYVKTRPDIYHPYLAAVTGLIGSDSISWAKVRDGYHRYYHSDPLMSDEIPNIFKFSAWYDLRVGMVTFLETVEQSAKASNVKLPYLAQEMSGYRNKLGTGIPMDAPTEAAEYVLDLIKIGRYNQLFKSEYPNLRPLLDAILAEMIDQQNPYFYRREHFPNLVPEFYNTGAILACDLALELIELIDPIKPTTETKVEKKLGFPQTFLKHLHLI